MSRGRAPLPDDVGLGPPTAIRAATPPRWVLPTLIAGIALAAVLSWALVQLVLVPFLGPVIRAELARHPRPTCPPALYSPVPPG